MLCLAGKTLPASRGDRVGSGRQATAQAYALGRGLGLGQQIVGHAQVGVQVPAQGVAQDRAQVLGQLVDERVARRSRPPPAR